MATILQAATQVLAQEGAGRFTTARVAEKAGVSVGSVYQYFPKAAILFRLQSDEWRQTQEMLSRILEDQARPPLARLRALVHAFVRSECEEAEMRVALSDAARSTETRRKPAKRGRRARNLSRLHARGDAQGLAGRPGPGGRLDIHHAERRGQGLFRPRAQQAEIGAYADAMADMFCAYIADVAHRA